MKQPTDGTPNTPLSKQQMKELVKQRLEQSAPRPRNHSYSNKRGRYTRKPKADTLQSILERMKTDYYGND